jgi:predicted metal-dependent hydrolase
MRRPDPRWTRGVDLFNRGEFFEAHEVVEDLWNETGGAERDFLKGFIQAAVALEHHRRGNPAGLRSVATTASGHLGRAAPDAGGLDVTALRRDLEEFRARAERGEDPPWPVARWIRRPEPDAVRPDAARKETP